VRFERPEEAVRFLSVAVALRPASSTARNELGNALVDLGQPRVAITEYRAAIRLKPDESVPHYSLGIALTKVGEMDAAATEYREAIRLKPEFAEAHTNLGNLLWGKGKHDAAIAEAREAIRLKPELTEAHVNLANALWGAGQREAAIAQYRKAIRLRPEFADAHYNYGCALGELGDIEGAMIEYRETIRLNVDDPRPHRNLASALRQRGDLNAAVFESREAIRIEPQDPTLHFHLALCLQGLGQLDESLAEFRRGHELGSKQPGWRHPSDKWVAEAEHLLKLAGRLPALLRGQDQLTDPTEKVAVGQLCHNRGLHVAAVRLYADAFAARPKLADDLAAADRYTAACSAALAGCGIAKDDAPPDEAVRAKLRAQALDWLKADLGAWAKLRESDPKATAQIEQALRHWQKNSDLAGVRDEPELAKLPEAERVEWKALWADVAALLKSRLVEH
jgi:tetratricopeptide (TPR) repeat protein